MSTFKLIITFCLFVAIISLTNCNKHRRGCTDPLALNFDPGSTSDDGSCKYTSPKNIGDLFGGGIVFYTNDNGIHGLIVTSADLGNTITWNNGTGLIAGKTSTAFGMGQSNTNTIIGAQGIGNYAAAVCNNLILDGYSDWFLPSQDELLVVYSNLQLKGIGNFAASKYWSSSEANISEAYSIDFKTGLIENTTKTSPINLRAVRSF